MLGRIVMAANAQPMKPVAAAMQRKLQAALKPVSLTIIDESHKHAGHSGNPKGGPDAETHFRVEVVSESFAGVRAVKRHQMIYALLDEEIKGGVHALSMTTKAPGEP